MILLLEVVEIRLHAPESECGVTIRIVTSTNFDFDHFASRSAADEGPGHGLLALADRLDAVIHQPDASSVKAVDRVRSSVAGRPEHWALAREVLQIADPDDVIYCTGDDAGFPMALLAIQQTRDAMIGTQIVGPGRLRTRVLTQLFARMLPNFFVSAGTISKAAELRSSLPDSVPVILATQQTDTGFFRPSKDVAEPLKRPLIVSCGLEQRDYDTLAKAVRRLTSLEVNTDVKICVASPNKTSDTQYLFPDVVPDNMEMRLFEFAELRELYQQATVTVVPVLPNNYIAGLTTMMEAMACGSPVIMTELGGLPGEFADRGAIINTPPGDAPRLADAIRDAIDDPARAAARAEIALEIIQSEHAAAAAVERFAEGLQKVIDDRVVQ